jgi:hypothetical protein
MKPNIKTIIVVGLILMVVGYFVYQSYKPVRIAVVAGGADPIDGTPQ